MTLGWGRTGALQQDYPSRKGATGPRAVEKLILPHAGKPREASPATDVSGEPDPDRVYLDLTPIKSFTHSDSGVPRPGARTSPTPPHQDPQTRLLPLLKTQTPPLMTPHKSPENRLQVQGLRSG